MKIHVTIPTNNFEVFYNKFYQGISAFENFKSTFTFGINFQNYTQEQIDTIISEFKKYDLEVYYTINHYDFPIHAPEMQVIRNDCAKLNPIADYYLICDDDLKYYNTETFKKTMEMTIQLLEENPNCTVLSLQRRRGFKSPHRTTDISLLDRGPMVETYLGLFLKNIYPDGQIVADEYLHCIGGYNDLIMAYSRLLNKNDLGIKIYTDCGEHVDAKPRSEVCFAKYGWHKSDRELNSNRQALIKIHKIRAAASLED